MKATTTLLAAAVVFAAAASWARSEGTPASAEPASLGAIVIDPGHGGDNVGAEIKGRREKDLALNIARLLRAQLERLGAKARLTRDSDVYVPLDRRVAMADSAAAFVSLHLNQVRFKDKRGILVFAFGHGRFRVDRASPVPVPVPPLPDPPPQIERAGVALSQTIAASLRSQGLRVLPPKRADFYVLRNPTTPSVLIELGYLTNPQERRRLSDPAYQKRLAKALATGIHSHLLASRVPDAVAARR